MGIPAFSACFAVAGAAATRTAAALSQAAGRIGRASAAKEKQKSSRRQVFGDCGWLRAAFAVKTAACVLLQERAFPAGDTFRVLRAGLARIRF